MKPIVQRNLPMSDYQRITAWNPSLVKLASVSLRHLRHAADNRSDESTDAQVLGQAEHCAILEPDQFVRRFVLWDGGQRRGKAWESFCEANAGREPLRVADYAKCLAMRDAARAHPAAGPLLDGLTAAECEVSIQWESFGGLACKGRLDAVGLGRGIVDIKTTAQVDPRRFAATAARFGYHVSMAAYQEGAIAAGLIGPADPVHIICVESVSPHDVVVYQIPDDVLAAGLELWRSALQQIAHCESTGIWPGISDDTIPLILPAWAGGDDDAPEITIGGEVVTL